MEIKEMYATQVKRMQCLGWARSVMVKAMDCGIVVSEFELQSRYYVHFRTNTLGKVRTPLTSQQKINSTTTVLLEG